MINQYVIYGERHSGTKFLEKLLTNNFHLTKATGFGHKHFFRPDYIFNSSRDALQQTLFLCIVRNPYDWIMACHKLRYHCNISGAAKIYNFISKEWSSREEFVGPEILADRHMYADRRYKNIFEMRWAKNNYLINILPIYVYNYIFLRYEDFLIDSFQKIFLQKIEQRFKLRSQSSFITQKFINRYYYNKIDHHLLSYINNNLYWDIENQIGYAKAQTVSELVTPLDNP